MKTKVLSKGISSFSEWIPNKKADISTKTIISILILLITLVILFFIIINKWKLLQEIWGRGPLG